MRPATRAALCVAAALAVLLLPAVPSRAHHNLFHLESPSAYGYPVDFDTGDIVCGGANRIQVLYGVIEGQPNNFTSAKPFIQREAMNMSGVLNTEAELKSNETRGARMRFVCEDGGRPSVRHAGTFPPGVDVAGSAHGAYVYARLLCDRGFDRPDRIYLVVIEQHERAYAAHEACPGAEHAFSNVIDHHVMLHETLHSMGAVAVGAPGSDDNTHCVESKDVMCHPEPGFDFCPERMQVDCRENTYFDPRPETGEWLARYPQHNLGLCSNVWTNCTYVNRGPSLS